MSRHSLSLTDYQAISDATICLNGITVLSGINGCGKSTISRWIYYVINGLHRFEKNQARKLINSIATEVYKSTRFFRQTDYSNKYNEYLLTLNKLRNESNNIENDLEEFFTSFVLQAENDLQALLASYNENALRRASLFLLEYIGTELPTSMDIIKQYKDRCNTVFEESLKQYHTAIEEHSKKQLEECIRDEYSERAPFPKKFSFEEEGVNLLEGSSFSQPLMLDKAIYIDTPMVLSEQAHPSSDSCWGRFYDLLINSNPYAAPISSNINMYIRKVIKGNVKLVKDELEFSKELHYESNNGLDIKLYDAATGIKSFAYIQRLLENGWLTKQTLLIIDEPEAHLHPQWIVEFARLLVILHKEQGVKIMIASHNPDMISAIHDIALSMNLDKSLNFYLADKKEEDYQYYFKSLGTDIGEIFTSFNIALDRIERYSTIL